MELIPFLILLPTLLFLIVSLLSVRHKGIHPRPVIALSKWSTYVNLLIGIGAAVVVYQQGLIEVQLLDVLIIRIDPLSILLFNMIALLAIVIFRYSINYLDGDSRHGAFIGRLALTVAAVQLLVLSGSLVLLFIAWVSTSIALHRLLVFYKERPRAIVAAKKKFIVARLGDLFLGSALLLLYVEFNSNSLQGIFTALNELEGIPLTVTISGVLFVLAAVLKSAQFPTHGWLIEVMETPTPVSALLHAGLLNAGPFLMARFSSLIIHVEAAQFMLILIGGITALFASVTFLTQPSIKTALGYSSIAHMGFMLMVCGMGVYAAAMLHLVAHSFYKAHAFLSSGGQVEALKANRIALPQRSRSPFKIGISIVTALLIYIGLAWLWKIDPVEETALLATGAIIIMGLAQIITPAYDSSSYLSSIMRATGLAVAVGIAFFSLETGFHFMLASQLPVISEPGIVIKFLILTILVLFAAAVFIQLAGPSMAATENMKKLDVHFRNGWYANIWFDRLIGGWNIKK